MQGVDTLLYNLIGRGFDCRLGRWVFSWTESFWPHYGPDVVLASLTEMSTRDISWAAKAGGV
jgi:hypothetical protein